MKKHLLISIPSAPNAKVQWEIADWLPRVLMSLPQRGWSVDYVRVQGKPVCSTRNRQCRQFMEESEADVVLFVDDDAVPTMEGLFHLLDAIVRDDIDIVGGWSLMSDGTNPGIPVVLGPAAPDAEGCPNDFRIAHLQDGLHDITGGGLGGHCMMVKRRVVEAMWDRSIVWFEDLYYTDKADGKKYGTRKWGHDVLFCRKAADLGFKVWLDNRVFWGHVKPMDLKAWYEMNATTYEEIASHVPLVTALRRLWTNEDWSAGECFLLRMCWEAHRLPEDLICVECGSGLTSYVLSHILPPERLVVLEEDPAWAGRVQHMTGLNGSVRCSDLKDYGEYDWYADPDLGGRKVGLVVCDGPRGTTRGGRYGALPRLAPHLADEFMFLLDDVNRPTEQSIVERWMAQREMDLQVVEDGEKKFAVLFGKAT